MKKILLSLVVAVTLSLSSFGQAPEGFKYQAVVRDAGNTILNNQVVGLRMTIQQGSIGGITVYSETFAPTTNMYGLVNLEVGNGTVISGTFANIDWSAGPYFMETAVDITGGTNYSVMGTSQLMSVPYALYAKTSGNGQGPAGVDGINGTNGINGIDGTDGAVGAQGPIGLTGPAGNDGATGPQGPAGNTGATGPMGPQGPAGNDGATGPQGIQGVAGNDGAQGLQGIQGPAGADGQGGVTTAGTNVTITGTGTVGDPYVVNAASGACGLAIGQTYQGGIIFYLDASGCHGLISAPTNQSAGAQWYNTIYLDTRAYGSGLFEGKYNTLMINYNQGGGRTAATICDNLSLGGYDDWYLPSIEELNKMYQNIGQGNALGLGNVGGFANLKYWSSTEFNMGDAWGQHFGNGYQDRYGKNYLYYVRAVRAF